MRCGLASEASLTSGDAAKRQADRVNGRQAGDPEVFLSFAKVCAESSLATTEDKCCCTGVHVLAGKTCVCQYEAKFQTAKSFSRNVEHGGERSADHDQTKSVIGYQTVHNFQRPAQPRGQTDTQPNPKKSKAQGAQEVVKTFFLESWHATVDPIARIVRQTPFPAKNQKRFELSRGQCRTFQ